MNTSAAVQETKPNFVESKSWQELRANIESDEDFKNWLEHDDDEDVENEF